MRLRLEWYLYDVETYGTLTIGCGVFYTSFIMWGIRILVQQPMLYIASSEVVVQTHICWIMKAGNTQPHIHILLKQPTLYISSSEATQHTHKF